MNIGTGEGGGGVTRASPTRHTCHGSELLALYTREWRNGVTGWLAAGWIKMWADSYS